MTYRESAWEAMPKEEREALEALVELAGDRERALELAGTIARKRRKARQDAVSDRGARVLVGAPSLGPAPTTPALGPRSWGPPAVGRAGTARPLTLPF